jgi:hypothetical protein
MPIALPLDRCSGGCFRRRLAAVNLPGNHNTVGRRNALPGAALSAMPRYHFDLIGKRTVRDLAGRDLSDDMLASDVADGLANELYSLRPDLRRQHCSILVTDEDGDEVHRAPIWNPIRD